MMAGRCWRMELEYMIIVSIFLTGFMIPICLFLFKNRSEIVLGCRDCCSLVDAERASDFCLHVFLILCACTPCAWKHHQAARKKAGLPEATKRRARTRPTEEGTTAKTEKWMSAGGKNPTSQQMGRKESKVTPVDEAELQHDKAKAKRNGERAKQKQRKHELKAATLKQVRQKGSRKPGTPHWSDRK